MQDHLVGKNYGVIKIGTAGVATRSGANAIWLDAHLAGALDGRVPR